MKRALCYSLYCAAGWLIPVSGFAVSPAQLQQRVAAGETIHFVDVRSTSLFQKGHIPGAISIPAGLAPYKELPRLGHVVVYDDGLGPPTAPAAAAALSKKPGILAEVLDGGFAAWESAQAATTRPAGMKPEALPVITYARLKEAQSSEVVLVDLRQRPPSPSLAKANSAPTLTDLSAEFPKARVVRSPFEATQTKSVAKTGATASASPLLVLIDSGDGAAEAAAHALKANGNVRFVILAGGEEILARKGEKGLQRLKANIEVPGPAHAGPSSTIQTQ